MASVFSIIGLLLGASFIISIEGLACYDNIFNDDGLVLIGCDFPGAACATTTKTTTRTSYYGGYERTTEVYHHCAKRTTSCIAGPLNYCTSNKNVECDTQCCDSNKCNSPQNGTSVDIPEVPATRATECYQLIGRRSERVKCLFKKAKCLFIELKPWLSSIYQDTEVQMSQYCASPKQCDQTKTSCDLIDDSSWMTRKSCSMNCCATTQCNSIPANHRYTEDELPEIDPRKIRHSWDGPKNYLTAVSPRTTTTTTARSRSTWKWRLNVDDYRYSNTNSWAWSPRGMRIWLKIVIWVVGIIFISSIVACCRKAYGNRRRTAVRTTRNNVYVAGYGQASQTV